MQVDLYNGHETVVVFVLDHYELHLSLQVESDIQDHFNVRSKIAI